MGALLLWLAVQALLEGPELDRQYEQLMQEREPEEAEK